MTTLTPRQHEIASMYAAGLRYAEIARRCGVVPSFAHDTVKRVSKRLGVSGRRELATALTACDVRAYDHSDRAVWNGIRRGDPVRITGGRFAGRQGTYWSKPAALTAYVRIGEAQIAVTCKHIEPIREAA